MTQTAETTAREQIYLSLAPFFMEAANGNHADARAAAEAMVGSLNPRTTDELILAAQIVVYGLAGMDSLRRSAENPDLPPNTHLRLRGNANAMQRSAQQCRKALHLRRKTMEAPGAETTPQPALTEVDIQHAIQRASAIIAEARAATQSEPGMNRAARRAAKFKARRAMRAAA